MRKIGKGKGTHIHDEGDGVRVEKLPLWLPSHLGREKTEQLQLQTLASQERQLREGQANDALVALQLELGYKALLFRSDVRNSNHVKGKTRAWSKIRKSSVEVRKHVWSYRHARQAMESLGADRGTMGKYKEIKKEDLKVSSDMVEENRFGQRNDKLAWFWRLGPEVQSDTNGDGWMEECEYSV